MIACGGILMSFQFPKLATSGYVVLFLTVWIIGAVFFVTTVRRFRVFKAAGDRNWTLLHVAVRLFSSRAPDHV